MRELPDQPARDEYFRRIISSLLDRPLLSPPATGVVWDGAKNTWVPHVIIDDVEYRIGVEYYVDEER